MRKWRSEPGHDMYWLLLSWMVRDTWWDYTMLMASSLWNVLIRWHCLTYQFFGRVKSGNPTAANLALLYGVEPGLGRGTPCRARRGRGVGRGLEKVAAVAALAVHPVRTGTSNGERGRSCRGKKINKKSHIKESSDHREKNWTKNYP